VAGAVIGGKQIKKKLDSQKAKRAGASGNGGYDPEAELEKAIHRVRELEREGAESVEGADS
jgi:hypothetical protein